MSRKKMKPDERSRDSRRKYRSPGEEPFIPKEAAIGIPLVFLILNLWVWFIESGPVAEKIGVIGFGVLVGVFLVWFWGGIFVALLKAMFKDS